MQQMSACPSCGSPVKVDQQFCGICGTKLSQQSTPAAGLKCPSCGSPINAGQQFCGTCGAKLAAGSRTAPTPPPPPPPPPAPAMQRAAPVSSMAMSGVSGGSNTQNMPAYEDASAFSQARANVKVTRTEAYKPKRRMLHFGGALFQALGWIVLVIGSLLSIAYIVLGAMGRGFQLSIIGNVDIIGASAIIVGAIGLVVSVVVGLQFIVIGRLCYSLIDLMKKVHEKGII